MVLTAPASFWSRSSACPGDDSRRSRVPTPDKVRAVSTGQNLRELKRLLGQLKPSKSIGGLRVYGLADRLAVAGVSGRASSRGSLGASLSETWETSLVSDKSSCSSAHDLEAALTFASESIVVLLPYVDFIEDVRFSRSRARVFVFGRKPPLSR